MIRPAPFRGDAPLDLPVGQVYRPSFLRRSLAYIANGDRPPMFTFGSVPSCNVLENQRQSAASSQRADTALRADGVAKRYPLPTTGKGPLTARTPPLAVKRTLADPGDRAIRACIVACSALFVACAGLAVTL